jgi:UDP-N-acetylmuramyl pentapeptide phosphotransferase/UDP-N-acetylglucosamine-1-phosphate transferase
MTGSTSLHIGLACGAAFGLSLAGVEGMRRWALRRRIVDVPNERSSHVVPTPRGGGLAVDAAVLLFLALLEVLDRPLPTPAFYAFVAGALVIVAVSWIDDLGHLAARVRFLFQFAAAAIAILACGPFTTVGPLTLPLAIGWAVTLFWIAGVTNAYNFMDGIDGIAATQAIVAGVGWTVVGWLRDDAAALTLAPLLAAASAGFLLHNWPPARIFMGDVCSAFLGYSFAVLPLLIRHERGRFDLTAVLVLWPFLFDTSITLLRRLRKRENVFQAHRSHLYQRLVIAGRSHRDVTALYFAMAMLGVLLAVVHTRVPASAPIVLGIVICAAVILWRLVIRAERRAAPSPAP